MLAQILLIPVSRPPMLHTPDGFFSPIVSVLGWLLAIIVIAVALRRTRSQLTAKKIPLMGVLAAFIFAAMSINMPVGGGTSGHLVGGTLAAILLGPWAAVVLMTCVVGVQALVFQDGGVLVLGANLLNMAVLMPFTGYLLYRICCQVLGANRRSLLLGGAIGGWFSMVVGAFAVGVELALSGTSPLRIAVPAMVGIHMLLGLVEAILTAVAFGFISGTKPELLGVETESTGAISSGWIAVGLIIAFGVAALSPLASAAPDGLETVAEQQGFIQKAIAPIYSIFPDYSLPFVGNQTVSGLLAVVLGTLLVFAIVLGAARVLGKRNA